MSEGPAGLAAGLPQSKSPEGAWARPRRRPDLCDFAAGEGQRAPDSTQTPKCMLSSHFLENEWLTEGGALCHLAAPDPRNRDPDSRRSGVTARPHTPQDLSLLPREHSISEPSGQPYGENKH